MKIYIPGLQPLKQIKIRFIGKILFKLINYFLKEIKNHSTKMLTQTG
jgi:hypothetical protein